MNTSPVFRRLAFAPSVSHTQPAASRPSPDVISTHNLLALRLAIWQFPPSIAALSPPSEAIVAGSLYALVDVMRAELDDPQTYKIIGAAMAVHRALGCGFLEAVSREAFTIELGEQGIPFVREVRLPVRYRNRLLPVSYTVDFICYGEVLVELKALHAVGPIETAQLINYLRAAGRSRGLLLNFGAPSLQHKRIVVDLTDDPVSRS